MFLGGDYMCIFCEIANKKIASNIIYEDDSVFAFLDLSQAGKGHTLVIPKKHYTDLLEIDDADYLHVMEVAKKIASVLKKTFSCEGINILNNCGSAAGQSVFHFHVHVIPRYNNDKVTIIWEDHSDMMQKEELLEIKESILKNI